MNAPFKPWLPKADMHVHLEGTITPAMVKKLAAKNGVDIKPGLLGPDGARFQWSDDGSARERLIAFVTAYDDACAVMKTAGDYTDITYDYLTGVAAEGCIYAELTISADHGRHMGLSYTEMLDAIQQGCTRARDDAGIEARAISTCVRHYGRDAALKVGEITAAHPHPLVTGFGMAGDENAGTVADFAPAFDASGLLNRTAHAGEAAGAESVRAARDLLRCRRFGHMVRAVEDAALMQDLVAVQAVPEVCVSSNMALRVYDDYAAHPLRRFFDAGLKVTLGSDDPSFFGTTIGREYEIAQEKFGFSDAELLRVTRNAVEEAFVDATTRASLLARIDDAESNMP
jgi:adenosine deaminase